MRALRFTSFGGVDALSVETTSTPERAPSEILIDVRAASINPSDVKNVQGRMTGTTLPRTPGRDAAGVVIAGPAPLVGLEIWSAGGEIGYTRDGSHAELLLLPESAVAVKPANLTFAESAACGVAFVTAWSGLHDVLRLEAGETLVVSGANGAVGSAVVQLARWRGATTIGVTRGSKIQSGADYTVSSDAADLGDALRALAPQGRIHAIFDTVGEPVFSRLLQTLGENGRYALIANTGAEHVELALVPFYRRRLLLGGVDSRAIDAIAAAKILERIRPGFESGALVAPKVDRIVGLDDAITVYRAIAAGKTQKTVIDPHA